VITQGEILGVRRLAAALVSRKGAIKLAHYKAPAGARAFLTTFRRTFLAIRRNHGKI
jgi:hypothetical protein